MVTKKAYAYIGLWTYIKNTGQTQAGMQGLAGGAPPRSAR